MAKMFRRAFSKDNAKPQPKPRVPDPKTESMVQSSFSPKAIMEMETELNKVGVKTHKMDDGSLGLEVFLPEDDLSSSPSDLAKEVDLVRNYVKLLVQDILAKDKSLLCMISGYYNDSPMARMNRDEDSLFLNFYRVMDMAEDVGGEGRIIFVTGSESLDAAKRSSIRKTFFSRLRELIPSKEFREIANFVEKNDNVPSSELQIEAMEPAWGKTRIAKFKAIASNLKSLASEIEDEHFRHPAEGFDADGTISKSWMFIRRTIHDLKIEMLKETIDDFLSVMSWTLLRKRLEYINRNAQFSTRVDLAEEIGSQVNDSESADRWLDKLIRKDFLRSDGSLSIRKLEMGLYLTGQLMDWFGKEKGK
jgi:hypothetical protein